jgi:3-oxoacyl-ACP reductase-like protein
VPAIPGIISSLFTIRYLPLVSIRYCRSGRKRIGRHQNDDKYLHTLQKLKKKIEEVPISKSIKDLVGSTSTLQNEILGDLQMESMSTPERREELPLEELDAAQQLRKIYDWFGVACS